VGIGVALVVLRGFVGGDASQMRLDGEFQMFADEVRVVIA
jgi:hypothetical protein